MARRVGGTSSRPPQLIHPCDGAARPIAARNSVQAFDDQPCDVEAGVPEQASAMYAADGTTIATFYSQNRQVVAPRQIPKVMRQAIVSIEDRRFYEHHGVDMR